MIDQDSQSGPSKPRRFARVGVWVFSAWLAACATEEAAVVEHPNIVMIIGDDHDYRDFGFMGSKIARTPNLDRLASTGTLFNVAYTTASVCRPSLQTLLTGLHPLEYRLHEAQLHRGRRSPLISSIHTLPSRLEEVGYASFQSGKHWEGSFRDAGFSDGTSAGAGRLSRYKSRRRLLRKSIEPVADFVEKHSNQPFLLWFAPMLPHVPHNPPPEYLAPYQDTKLSPAVRKYYASIAWFDAGVGELLQLLDDQGLTERTLVVYLADNGWYPDPHSADVLGGKKGKLSLYEPGFRTPLIMSWPGHIPVGVRDDLISIEDLFPTLLGFSGAHPQDDRRGIDLRPYLDNGHEVPRDALVGAMQNLRPNPKGASGFFVRTRTWRYLLYDEGAEELYRIDRDPLEKTDLASSRPEIVRRMRTQVRDWEAEIREASRRRLQLALRDASSEKTVAGAHPILQPSQRF